jgi:methyl-accepting chemotaxis protein
VKLRVSFGILLAMTMIVSVIGIIGINRLNKNVSNLTTRTELANDAIKMCRIDTNIAARAVREMALNEDTSTYADYKQTVEEKLLDASDQLSTLKKTGVIEESKYQEYVDELTQWANTAYAIVEIIESGDRETGIEMIFSDCVPALERMVTLAQELDSQVEVEVNSSVRQSKIAFRIGIVALIAVTLLAAVLSILIGKSIIESITVPLVDIESSAKELSQGNLHTQIDYEAGNELGLLAENLRDSISTLSDCVEGISHAMGEFANGNFEVQPDEIWKGDFVEIKEAILMFEQNMAETIEGLQQVAEQVESGATQVADSSMELAEGATEQASVMMEFTSTVEAVSGQVSENASYASRISKRVEEVGVEIEHTNEGMQQMVESMNKIEESSQKIHKIIDAINDIAAQTNLLALNASIEAARAGEAGRGFAVVANQVTTLATQSADAARESAELIETSIHEVASGMALTAQIAAGQERVASDAKAIVEDVNNIADNLSAQSESFSQLNSGITQINDVIQSNSATSQQCAASSQEMSNQANTLGSLIHKFRVLSA